MGKPQITVDHAVAKKVAATVRKGLSQGLGSPTPGSMCVEAAVCYAMGLDHDDSPPCVGDAVRAFKIYLNDQDWENPRARARGLLRVAVAQLGSKKINQNKFVKLVVLGALNTIMPMSLRRFAKDVRRNQRAHVHELATEFEAVQTTQQARRALNRLHAFLVDVEWSSELSEAVDTALSILDSSGAKHYADNSAYLIKELAIVFDTAKQQDKIRRYGAEAAVQALITLGAQGAIEFMDVVPEFKG